MNGSAIFLDQCTKVFRRCVAVHNLSLSVETGQVYGLVGDNGAGKTTTIKMMLGLLHPHPGQVKVLGYDPWVNGVEMKKRIGYVSEGREMYPWMRVSEILWFQSQFYETWDQEMVEQNLKTMELPPKEKIKNLSRGMRAKLALLLAMGHRPDLLILDEPSSGLDPIVRREILEQIISIIQSEGRTVFFSSHLLDEVERVADRVGILCRGQLLRDDPLDTLKQKVKRIRVVWDGEIPRHETFKQVRFLEGTGREEAFFVENFEENLLEQFRAHNPKSLDVESLSLEEIFVQTVRSAKAQ